MGRQPAGAGAVGLLPRQLPGPGLRPRETAAGALRHPRTLVRPARQPRTGTAAERGPRRPWQGAPLSGRGLPPAGPPPGAPPLPRRRGLAGGCDRPAVRRPHLSGAGAPQSHGRRGPAGRCGGAADPHRQLRPRPPGGDGLRGAGGHHQPLRRPGAGWRRRFRGAGGLAATGVSSASGLLLPAPGGL